MSIHTTDKNAMRGTSDHIRFVKFTRLELRRYKELMPKVTGSGDSRICSFFALSPDAIVHANFALLWRWARQELDIWHQPMRAVRDSAGGAREELPKTGLEAQCSAA